MSKVKPQGKLVRNEGFIELQVFHCEDAITDIKWRVSDKGKIWTTLKETKPVITYYGNKYYFVEFNCGRHQIIAGGNFTLMLPDYYAKTPANMQSKEPIIVTVPSQADWDFKKLPKSEFNTVIEYLDKSDARALRELHNKYNLSANEYCCGWENPITTWFRQAVDSGTIYRT